MKLTTLLVVALFSGLAFAKAAPVNKTTKISKKAKLSNSTAINTNSKKFDVRVPVKNWINKKNDGFRIGLGQGNLTTNARFRSNGFDESVQEDSSSKFLLTFGWEKIVQGETDYSFWATYHDMEFDGENMRSMRVAGNVTYGINAQVYTYGGLNWNKYYGSEFVESNYEAGAGYQLGLGFKFHKRANLEMEYITLLNEGKTNGINANLETKGILLKLITPFRFQL